MATYNCADSTDNTYGSGGFGTCTGQSIGAPNTGVFEQIISGGSFTILGPLVAAVILITVALLVIRRRLGRRRDKQPNTDQRAFTIVELLIVIVVIGVLAAIVVVAFNGVSRNARNASVQSDIRNFQKQIDIRKAEDGSYPAPAQLTAADGIRVNKPQYLAGGSNNWYYCRSTDQSRFAVGATAESSRAGFVYDSATGLRTEAAVRGASTCPNAAGQPYEGTSATNGCVWSGGTCAWAVWIN